MLKVASVAEVIGAIHFAKTILEAIFADINVAFASNKSLVCRKRFLTANSLAEKENFEMAFWVLFSKIAFNFRLLTKEKTCLRW